MLPFVGGAVLVHLVWPEAHPYAVLALAAYAATIVAFLGGVHWGVAFTQARPDPKLFAWGVVPSLVAWVAIVMPPSAGLVVLGALPGPGGKKQEGGKEGGGGKAKTS